MSAAKKYNLRLLSCGDSTFNYDLLSEDRDGKQDSTISVFTHDSGGTLRHYYTAHPRMADDIDRGSLDLLGLESALFLAESQFLQTSQLMNIVFGTKTCAPLQERLKNLTNLAR